MASQSQSQRRNSSGSDADNGAASDDEQNTERYKVIFSFGAEMLNRKLSFLIFYLGFLIKANTENAYFWLKLQLD